MNRTLAHIRASMALGVLVISYGVVPQVQAADQTPQRVAMACTHASQGSACAHATQATGHAAPQRASTEPAAAKAHARRAQEVRPVAAVGDGSRFAYDSCGCSNE